MSFPSLWSSLSCGATKLCHFLLLPAWRRPRLRDIAPVRWRRSRSVHLQRTMESPTPCPPFGLNSRARNWPCQPKIHPARKKWQPSRRMEANLPVPKTRMGLWWFRSFASLWPCSWSSFWRTWLSFQLFLYGDLQTNWNKRFLAGLIRFPSERRHPLSNPMERQNREVVLSMIHLKYCIVCFLLAIDANDVRFWWSSSSSFLSLESTKSTRKACISWRKWERFEY